MYLIYIKMYCLYFINCYINNHRAGPEGQSTVGQTPEEASGVREVHPTAGLGLHQATLSSDGRGRGQGWWRQGQEGQGREG